MSAAPASSRPTNRRLNDLEWSITSPPLLDFAPCRHPAFDRKQVDPAELDAFLHERPDARVGHYFENLVCFWLQRIRKVRILDHRRQVMNDHRTVGEIDFVFEDESGCVTHWETAVKFYLRVGGDDDDPDRARFLGPNTSDSLERKIRRLREHQLPLGLRTRPEIQVQGAFVKGLIYDHLSAGPCEAQKQAVEGLNPGHLRGTWIRHSEANNETFREGHERRRFALLNKPAWLSDEPEKPLNFAAFQDLVRGHFATSEASLHVTVSEAEGGGPTRLFVVHDEWPRQRGQ